MPLNKIEISRTFHLGDHNFFKVGQEGTIEENETREGLAQDAMTFIDATLKKYFPENEVIVSSVIVNKEPEYFTEEIDEPKSMEEQINSCKSATVLKAVYEPIIKKMPELEKI